jgi:hypothetical protein
MSREMMLGLLRQGNNGNDILSILDVIATDVSEQSVESNSAAVSYITGEAIEF